MSKIDEAKEVSLKEPSGSGEGETNNEF